MKSFLSNWLGFSRDSALAIIVALFLIMLCIMAASIVLFWLTLAFVAAMVSLPFFLIKKITWSCDF
jgi:hypothetical protein